MPMDLFAHIKTLEICDGKPYPKSVELLSREYETDVSPKIKHGIVQANMIAILRRLAGNRGLVLPELHVHPGRVDGSGRAIVPDVSFVSWERVDMMTPADAGEPTSPDIAVEVRSPSNDLAYLEEKIELALSTGTLLALDVIPDERAIIAYSGDTGRRYE